MADRKPPTVHTSLEWTDAIARADQGDRSALAQVHAAFDKDPGAVQELGDLGRIALASMVDLSAGEHVLVREAQMRVLTQMEKDIAGQNPTPLERLLAQEIVLCRQHLSLAEERFAEITSCSFAEGEYHQRWLNHAQRRYLAAVKTLAQVRRLQLPAVQVNVAAQGGQQVNVATAGR